MRSICRCASERLAIKLAAPGTSCWSFNELRRKTAPCLAPALPSLPAKSATEFVRLREERDRTLPMPKLILSALQVNINAGRLPEPEGNGTRYLKIPLGVLEDAVWDE